MHEARNIVIADKYSKELAIRLLEPNTDIVFLNKVTVGQNTKASIHYLFESDQPESKPVTLDYLSLDTELAIEYFGNGQVDLLKNESPITTIKTNDWQKQEVEYQQLLSKNGFSVETNYYEGLTSDKLGTRRLSTDKLGRTILFEQILINGAIARTHYFYANDAQEPTDFIYSINDLIFEEHRQWLGYLIQYAFNFKRPYTFENLSSKEVILS
ncbi:hypothetical protein [Pediococcus argentinicus]|uniref:Uncharacterized protein n=1 Tax=Pediococcus argentinicus TaxID=480391 RepID=A0A0R2NQB9_9LACO|nr:hypothetical protein [Pediococcus argentinicus]KRO26221.1 hypothetical protein IV88_GL000006 [Pediococcus argentinicus]NKZ22888.1 hypothetical protein [Pediococcus argentinicus]GEP20370.1 hypothetical protein LSA03_17540 [Pediococcus argentinicus]